MDQDELNEKIHVLKKHIEEGKLKFFKGLKVIDSLEKVRYDASGNVEPNTVDGLVRSLANVVSFVDYREELKKIPLKDVMEKYYEFLEIFFGTPYREMTKNKVTPYDIASSIASNDNIVSAFQEDSEEFERGLVEFWENFGPVVNAHIEDMRCLKTVYGGDIFPNYENNAISNTSLYVDTIIFPDPVLRCSSFFRFFEPKRAIHYIVKHALSVLSLKDVVLADVEPPIAIIAPDSFLYDESTRNYINSLGEKDLLVHMGRAFDREFKSDEELDNFLNQINDLAKLKAQLKDKDRILFDVKYKDLPIEEIWEKMKEYNAPLPGQSIGQQLGLSMKGRMMQVNDLLMRSSRLGGTPLIDAPTSWQYFLWKYEYDQEISRAINPEMKNLLAIKAMQADDMSWLGNIPYDVLVKLRREGAMHKLREMITQGLEEINGVSEADFEAATEKIINNINHAMEEHNKELKDLSGNAKKYFGFDIAPWLTFGGISIAAATTGNIPLSVTSALTGMIGCPSARDLWSKGKDLLEHNKKIKRSPIGLFFEAKDSK